MKKIYFNIKKKNSFFAFLFVLTIAVNAQTNPTAQSLPYTQDFGTLSSGSSTYPNGWQGWQLSSSGASGSYRTNAATGDLSLNASSSASTTSGGIHNYNSKIGILQSSSSDPSIVLAITTTSLSNITISYDVMTMRNPYDGTTNTRINEFTLQYRLSTSGSFTSISGIEYQNNTTMQTGSGVTTPQNVSTKTIALPSSCDNQTVVQIRWVARDVSGAGSRPSFAVDNISVSSGGTSNSTTAWVLGGNSNATSNSVVGTTTAMDLTFKSNTGTMTLNQSGNLGIGISPSERLHVSGNAIISGTVNSGAITATTIKLTSSPTNGYILTSDGSGNASWQASPNASVLGGWSLTGNSGTTAGTNFLGTTDAADLLFKAHNGTMTLLQNGNLGIGISSPQEKLDVNGNILLNYNHLYFTTDHNYGIGYEQYFIHQVPATSYYNSTGIITTAATTEQYTINSSVLAGVNGGALGSNLGATQNIALSWFADGGVSIGKNSHDGAAVLDLGGNLEMDGHDILLRNHHHGLGVYYSGRIFNTAEYNTENIDGPVLYGWNGGALGSKYFTGPVIGHTDADDLETIALHWYRSGQVGIKTNSTPIQTLDVNGGINITQGVIQKGGTSPVGTADLGLYSLDPTTWMRFVTTGQPINFYTNGGTNPIGSGVPALLINANGSVGINTDLVQSSGYKLAVNGNVRAKKIVVDDTWADFVFENKYQLKTLCEVERYIKQNGHLPEIPSSKQIETNGADLGELVKLQMQKIEELTLYIIEQNKRVEALEIQSKNK